VMPRRLHSSSNTGTESTNTLEEAVYLDKVLPWDVVEFDIVY